MKKGFIGNGQAVTLIDNNGQPIGTLGGAINTHSADVHLIPVNRRFAQFPGIVTSTLSVDASIGDISIDIQAGDYASFNQFDWIFLKDGSTEETDFLQITVKPGSPIFTLDRPLDKNYSSATATVEVVQPNLASAVGTLVVPVSFKIQPPGGDNPEIWHITRLNLSSTNTTAQSSIDEFLSLTALINGVVLRQDNDGLKKIWTNWKTDSDIMEDQYDIDPVPKPPAGKFGQRGRWWLKRADVIIKLNGATNDFAEFLAQDNLTGGNLTDWQMKAQGHLEGE